MTLKSNAPTRAAVCSSLICNILGAFLRSIASLFSCAVVASHLDRQSDRSRVLSGTYMLKSNWFAMVLPYEFLLPYYIFSFGLDPV